MNSLFKSFAYPDLNIDSDDSRIKHDSLFLRFKRDGFFSGSRRIFITCRFLSEWLVSDWKFKRYRMGIRDLCFDPVKYGLFYSLRLGGRWVPADWWLHYFAFDERFTSLRLDHLCDDLNSHVLPLIDPGLRVSKPLPFFNQSKLMVGQENYYLTSEDISLIYQQNPFWASWELESYQI